MIKTTIKGIDLVFETSAGVFSPKGIDLGTLSMLSVVDFQYLLQDKSGESCK